MDGLLIESEKDTWLLLKMVYTLQATTLPSNLLNLATMKNVTSTQFGNHCKLEVC